MLRRMNLEKKIFFDGETDFERFRSPFAEHALQSLENKEAIRFINEGIAQLPAKERIPFVLFEITNMSVGEIAKVISKPQYTTRRRIASARDKIEKHIKEKFRIEKAGVRSQSKKSALGHKTKKHSVTH